MINSDRKHTLPFSLCIVLLLMFLFGEGCLGIPQKALVCDIQGSGLISPFLDQEVIISGIVIADLERIEPGGLMILDENCPQHEGRSRGLYVSLVEGVNPIDLGDEIQVQGIVREKDGETYLEASSSSAEILSVDNPLPEPIALTDYLAPPITFSYEAWEGQLVAISKADLEESLSSPGSFQIIPQISPDPSVQLVCFQLESFSLQINLDFLGAEASLFQHAGELEDLIGLIRQDKNGYIFQLLEQPALRLKDKNLPIGEETAISPVSYQKKSPTLTSTSTVTPSKTPEPYSSPTPIPSPTQSPSPTYYPIQLLISELLPDPVGKEPGGEWIEIVNPLGNRLPLDGIKIGDEMSPDGSEGMLVFPDGHFINAGQILVIANQASIFKSTYGFLPDFELVDSDTRVPDLVPYHRWGRNAVKLSNSGDEVLILDPWDGVVDLVAYGKKGVSGFTIPVAAPAEGHSLERFPPEEDSDQAGDWRERSAPSPGRLDYSPPTITATQTSSPTPVLTNFITASAITATPSPFSTTICPTASDTTTGSPAGTSTPTQNGTPTPQLTSPASPSPTDPLLPSATHTPAPSSTTTASLAPSCTETAQDSPSVTPMVTMTTSLTCTPTQEVLPTCTPTLESTTIVPSETAQSTVITTVPLTPIPSPTISPAPVVIINEILADPDPVQGDSNGDGVISSDDDEFLELVNISEMALDLSGWRVFDAVRHRYTFPEGTSLSPGCGLVIFGGGVPAGDFGGSLVFTASSLGLNNTGDLITLFDPDGVEMAAVSYSSEGNQDQSLTRDPDLIGSLPLVLHSQVPGAGGALFSPGKRVDQSSFGGCP